MSTALAAEGHFLLVSPDYPSFSAAPEVMPSRFLHSPLNFASSSLVMIWLALTPDRISAAATVAIREADLTGELSGISVMTIYEVAFAIRLGRIEPIVPHHFSSIASGAASRYIQFPIR